MKIKSNFWLHAFLTLCTILAVVLATIIIYAEDHPNTKICQEVESFGFHLKK